MTEADVTQRALEQHAALMSAGPLLGSAALAISRVGNSSPLRAAAAVGGALRSGTIVRTSERWVLMPVARLMLQLVLTAQGPLVMAAVGGLMLLLVHGLRPRTVRWGRRLGTRGRRRYVVKD